ncbi:MULTISPECIES: alanine racemase [unclassified Methylophilus]|uniref:alanine racemase n=1 Tax=unclassified Methylophilus TaxID=2630143 RepID=UPI0006F4F418|nr:MULTISPECIES: alanine racemase [unclassified Methylophilus]KQT43511.1 alanine racemase [Methylophilus sp. Leaf416]KQT58997.1 alanine racemase [Methylophilus sp. Leaf459]
MRPIVAYISEKALAHNLARVRQYAPESKVISVVKANAYGHGLLNAARGLKETDAFAVLNISEAVTLRDAGYQHPILLLEGVFSAEEIAQVDRYRLDMVISHRGQLQWLLEYQVNLPVRVYLKLDSGMHRLGFQPSAYQAALDQLAASGNVSEIVLMTHFANSDIADGVTQAITIVGQVMPIQPYKRSLANSAAIVQQPHTHADWVRPGIMLYGATPIADKTAVSLGLQPVMTLQSGLIGVQEIQAGESVGYGSLFTADKPIRVGIVACGYADGYPRHAPTGTPAAVNGVLTRTLGRVSMDMLAVDITDIPDANIGSRVELWGSLVPVDAVAQASGTIGYELLCAVTARVPMHVID